MWGTDEGKCEYLLKIYLFTHTYWKDQLYEAALIIVLNCNSVGLIAAFTEPIKVRCSSALINLTQCVPFQNWQLWNAHEKSKQKPNILLKS